MGAQVTHSEQGHRQRSRKHIICAQEEPQLAVRHEDARQENSLMYADNAAQRPDYQ